MKKRKRKKSLVGYTDENIWESFSFIHHNIKTLYLTELKDEPGEECNPLKVRITIEEVD